MAAAREGVGGGLAGFAVVTEIPVAWAEMDAFGVVNHAVIFRYFEDARIPYPARSASRTVSRQAIHLTPSSTHRQGGGRAAR